ncbi:vegetative cell wall protein gp1-like [Sorghum bicolor]|uniref:vegetative cell wall protein gp1-like n=1 Tax=Sorghum bicolor TaxID=4558 RepID=UPI000B4248CD|nr:vegetative cell wall protein gp1-like [Sorghum bicolor]|eukprot:XP_021308278.1 vegetative cell wall protein gp1-like [Sorghum bicolor]
MGTYELHVTCPVNEALGGGWLCNCQPWPPPLSPPFPAVAAPSSLALVHSSPPSRAPTPSPDPTTPSSASRDRRRQPPPSPLLQAASPPSSTLIPPRRAGAQPRNAVSAAPLPLRRLADELAADVTEHDHTEATHDRAMASS